jgi:N-acetylglucosaminyldiphosphoundecaprenol N-acetyl-beta-D-mannosaminyltransferase
MATEATAVPATAPPRQTDADSDALIVRAADGRPQLDLGRDVHALLGLVFDRVDLDGAAVHIRHCVTTRRRCFLSTPNVNFVAAAAREREFRGSVLRSDLSVADGFPIVLAARWMGIDLPGRVAGADLFERLQSAGRAAQRPPIKLYLFGGPTGVAAQAAARLNAQAKGFECVGHDEGGFGDVEAMSSEATIARINASGAEFVLVALGARKGQAWIEHNRARLHAPVISHLGAVINFAAQSIERAPRWMQRVGLEWVWRIVQEPQLWQRYWQDGRMLVAALATRLVPWSMRRWLRLLPAGAKQSPQFTIEHRDGGHAVIKLSGDWRAPADQKPLRLALVQLLRAGSSVEFDLSAAPAIDSALLGLMALLDAWQVAPRAVHAESVTNRALRADVHAYGAQYLLQRGR